VPQQILQAGQICQQGKLGPIAAPYQAYLTPLSTQDDFKYVSRAWTHKVVKKEKQKGRFEMNKSVERKISAFIDKYFAAHAVYSRDKKGPEEEKSGEGGAAEIGSTTISAEKATDTSPAST